ncbi:zinc-ribbon domain-containing protein [Haloarcula sp. S1AR25-5A]|uniref:Zinc-ribbon domain-containing protein n=1 Tax=Haloarcula terrestris TaxID=2950533 RepID=A0AAE4JI96_9EURY|nr:MJ0042-type zinc finger domain-containing protein [Haloarcula terrestris]MDS0220881.1 zinc-ribbon domain-containing protein [Haloarcula terrestris]
MRVTCDRCESEFDTDRDAVAVGQDTTRCPKCGNQADVGTGVESDGGDGVVVASDGEEIHIHIHVHKHGG